MSKIDYKSLYSIDDVLALKLSLSPKDLEKIRHVLIDENYEHILLDPLYNRIIYPDGRGIIVKL